MFTLKFHVCSGMGASAIGLSHVAIQFPVYEFFKRWLSERRQRERGEVNIADRLSTMDLIVASSSSKVIGNRPARLPAHQIAVCASVAMVTPAHFSLQPPLPSFLAPGILFDMLQMMLMCMQTGDDVQQQQYVLSSLHRVVPVCVAQVLHCRSSTTRPEVVRTAAILALPAVFGKPCQALLSTWFVAYKMSPAILYRMPWRVHVPHSFVYTISWTHLVSYTPCTEQGPTRLAKYMCLHTILTTLRCQHAVTRSACFMYHFFSGRCCSS